MAEEYENDHGVVTQEDIERKVKKPRVWRVLIHNDNFTPRDFVVAVLVQIFHKGEQDATRIMLHVHHNGVGVAGHYTRQVAETKVRLVERLATEREYPLRCTAEPEDDEE